MAPMAAGFVRKVANSRFMSVICVSWQGCCSLQAFSAASRQVLKSFFAFADCVRIRNNASGFSVESDCSQQETEQLQQMQQQATSQWNKPGHPGWAIASQDVDLHSTPSLPEVSTRITAYTAQHTQCMHSSSQLSIKLPTSSCLAAQHLP